MRAVTALALLLCTAAGASPSHRSDPLEPLAWLAGCWRAESGDRTIEEQWMRPRAGSMLGMSRTTRGDSLVGYELMRIVAREGKLVFVAQPDGQAAIEFVADRAQDGAVVFANPEHDFPQRILYRRAGADSLIARIEGGASGQVRGFDFPYGRVPCP